MSETENPTPYEMLGGQEHVHALVTRFYDLMDLEPGYKELREAHGTELDSAREKLYLFLSGWLGGPNLYIEKYGHPMLRARHLPFAIGVIERDQWVACMRQAMDEIAVPLALKERLQESFFGTADWMRNQAHR
jgi:hemoglobin